MWLSSNSILWIWIYIYIYIDTYKQVILRLELHLTLEILFLLWLKKNKFSSPNWLHPKIWKKVAQLAALATAWKSKSNLSLSLGSGPVTVPKTRSACSAWKIWTAPKSSAISRVRTLLSEFARSALCICKENGWHVMKTESEVFYILPWEKL